MECKSCFDDITLENKVSYRIHNNTKWLPSYYCEQCTRFLLSTSWKIFTDQVKEADCKRALQKILEVGPPINLRDKTGFPDPHDNSKLTEINELLFSNGEQISAKLKGSFTGKKRQEYITFLENFKFS